MADNTAIEWTDATWNPITGCSVVSPGCTNCYAMKLAGGRLQHHPTRTGLTTASKAGPVWNGQVRFNADALSQPLRWKRPRRIFVCAHGDLFHESVPEAWIDQVFAVMALAPQHTFQVLTKRADRMRDYLRDSPDQARFERRKRLIWDTAYALGGERAAEKAIRDRGNTPEDMWPLANVWLGVSAEDQARAAERIPILLTTPGSVRFLSAEPLLGAIDLTNVWPDMTARMNAFTGEARHMLGMKDQAAGLDWVIVGGESGPAARPMHPEWARQIRDECALADVPFFFKQWGNWAPDPALDRPFVAHDANVEMGTIDKLQASAGSYVVAWERRRAGDRTLAEGTQLRVMGKKAAGRQLDGVEHHAMPEAGDAQ